MRKIALAAAVLGLVRQAGAGADPAAGTPTRIRGTVEKLDGQT